MKVKVAIVAAAVGFMFTTELQTAEAQVRSASWFTSATSYRGYFGQLLTFSCPPKRTRSRKAVYGSNPYTLDSGICRAGVHAGVITRSGGLVTIRITRGRGAYFQSFRYGVRTRRWGRYHTSFRVVRGGAVTARPPVVVGRPPVVRGKRISWFTSAARYRGWNGRKVYFYCPPARGRLTKSVWGSGFYTLDSGICKAAVHAGKISRAGGTVMIYITNGRPAYYGSYKYGIRTGSWRRYHTSFYFGTP